MKSQLKAGAILSYVNLFANSVISLVYTPVMLNLLGQSEYGLYSLASSVVGYLGVLNFGLGNSVIRYTSKYRALKNEDECANLYGVFFTIYGILGIVALAAGALLTINSPKMFANSLSAVELNKLKILMGIMVVNISMGVALGLFSCIALAYEKFVFQQVSALIGAIVNPIVMLPLLLMGYRSVTMVAITTALNLTAILVNIYYCFKVLKIKITIKYFDKSLIKEIVIFSFFIFLNLIIDKIYWSTDQIIIGKFLGAAAISVYSVGAAFSGYFTGFAGGISNVFLSRVTRMVTKEAAAKEISDLFIRIGRVQYIIISLFLSGFIVLGEEFIYLWVGESYRNSYMIALIIIIPLIIPLIQGMGGVILQAKNMQKFKSVVYFVIALANVFLSVIFVQKWGIAGCAFATALAFVIGNIIVMNIYYWKKVKIDIPGFWYNIFGMSTPLILSLVFGKIVNRLVPADDWIIFLAKTTLFSIIYALLMWFTAMNAYEKDLCITPVKTMKCKFFNRKSYNAAPSLYDDQ